MDSGAVLGVQVPRLMHVPDYVTSAGDEVVEMAALAGLDLDPWQQLVLRESMGEIPLVDDGGVVVPNEWRWASPTVCLLCSRQNGKNGILEARELAGLFLLDEQVIIHSAHEQSTSTEQMRRLLALIESVPDFDSRVKKVIQGKGSEAIELKSGQRILFRTRTGGGTRGFSIDLVVFDEAYDLPETAVSAMVPTLSARPNVQTWYTSSAVDQEKHQNGDALARQRERGIKKGPRIAYFDWSAAGDDPSKVSEADLSDPSVWAQANPALGRRITVATIQDELAGNMGSREFAVERLGIGDWPSQEPDAGRVIARDLWESLRERDSDQRIQTSLTFSLDVNPDRTRGSIGVSGMRADGLWQFAVADHRSGTGWMVDAVAELVEGRSATAIVILSRGPASNLIGDLEDKGLNVIRCGMQEYAEACADFFDTVARREVRYPFPQPELDEALTGAKRSSSENAWYWSRKASLSPDISSLVAVTIALWGAQHMGAPTVWSLAEVAQQAGLVSSEDSSGGRATPDAPESGLKPPGFVPL